MNSSPAVKGNLTNIEAFSKTLDEFLDVAVVDNVSFCGFQKSLSFPDIVGFTGTPLLKRDKKISSEVFGTYIHAYKYNEGVADGVVLDLRYEYRDVPQDLSSQDRVDQWFDVKTRGLSSRAKSKLKDYTSGAFEGYDPEDVKGLVKDRHDATVSYFEEVYDAVEELCEGVEEPCGEIQYIHYFCGVSGQSEESDEIYARLREKLYRLVSSLIRAFAEAKPYLIDDISSGKLNEYDKKVTFYIELKKTIGTASGDFLDLKAYEPDMRKMIDNYITAADAEKIGDFDDLTLLDFVAKQGETLTGEGDSGHKEGAAEAIENNIRKKVIEKVTVNPRYYAKMSEILDKLIEERKQGVLDYAEMLEKYIKLAKDVDCPEDNDKYSESIRKSKALMAIYDNTGEDEELAIRIHKAVKKQALFGFRDNQVVIRRIKKALYEILGDDSEVECIYKIIEKQEEF